MNGEHEYDLVYCPFGDGHLAEPDDDFWDDDDDAPEAWHADFDEWAAQFDEE